MYIALIFKTCLVKLLINVHNDSHQALFFYFLYIQDSVYKIKIFSTESLYSTYISDIFTEDELKKMSVSVFSDNEFEYPKDREVSDFSVKKLLYLNSHELSWISEILK